MVNPWLHGSGWGQIWLWFDEIVFGGISQGLFGGGLVEGVGKFVHHIKRNLNLQRRQVLGLSLGWAFWVGGGDGNKLATPTKQTMLIIPFMV